MFIREKKFKGGLASAIQIVENQRAGSTTKQHVLRHVGTGHTPEKITLLRQIAETIKTQMEHQVLAKPDKKKSSQFAKKLGKIYPLSKETLVDISQVKEISRSILGIHDIYGFIYDELGFTNLLTRPHHREAAANILREIVLARIADPKSKRASVELLQTKFNTVIDLDHVYNMMDKIDDAFCDRIQKQALSMTLKLTGEKLRVLFYDATTLYFESFTEDELKQNGYSKDCKFNQPQVLLVLLVTEKGLPVGYEVFSGNVFEGHTLLPALERLKTRYLLEDVIFVADRGLLSEENLKILEDKKFKYIVGARIRGVSKKMKKEILNEKNYAITNDQPQHIQKIATFRCDENRKLIVNYSDERARKDQYDRHKAIEKLKKKIAKSKNPKSLLSNFGYKKYIEIYGEAEVHINEEKLKNDTQWDGLLGVISNITDLNPEQILAHYRNLWQVEESFRINKHDLKIRPIYHWKPHRVRAHLAISFIAFVCVRYLEYRMSVQSQKVSPEMIRQALLQVQASILEDGQGKTYLLTAPISAQAKEIYRVMGIKVPAGMTEIR
jgi:transposase